MIDLKGFVLFTGAIIMGHYNEILQAAGLTANCIYIIYQIHTHHKKNNKQD